MERCAGSRIDYSCMFPVYTTIYIEESNTLEETFRFSHIYAAPVVDENRNCYGMIFTYLMRGEEWRIGRYTTGMDFVSAIEQYGIPAEGEKVYFLEILQFGDDFGFLSVSSDGEKYVSILEKHPKIRGTEELMNELRRKTHPNGTDADG